MPNRQRTLKVDNPISKTNQQDKHPCKTSLFVICYRREVVKGPRNPNAHGRKQQKTPTYISHLPKSAVSCPEYRIEEKSNSSF
jgi:hypothetical protein